MLVRRARRGRLLLLVCGLGSIIATRSAAQADSTEASAAPPSDSEQAAEEEKRFPNGVSLGAAYNLQILRDRDSATSGEPLNNLDHLVGFAIAYQRELIPERFALTIAKPFYFAPDRFDTPFDLTLKALFRRGAWEGFVGGTITWNIRIFERERAEVEGEKNRMSLGIGAAGGASYYFTDHWTLDLELGYSYVPTDDIVTHEIEAAISGAYHF